MSATAEGLRFCMAFETIVKVKLKKLSICPCGFSVLDESIPIGTEYTVHTDITDTFTFICGGCGKKHRIIGILVEPRGLGKAGFLPKDIFDMPLNDMELCACGRPLHYSDPQKRLFIDEQIARMGPTTIVKVGERQWEVPRHFIALHGLITDELPELAAKYKFRELKPDEKPEQKA